MAVLLLQEFRKEGYDPQRVTDAQLGDDWRLVAAKYATMRSGGKTEFADERELVLFAEGIVREILRRGKITFHPDTMEPTTLDLLRKCLSRIVSRAVYLVEPHGEWIHEGRKTAVVKARRFEALEQFNVLVSAGKAWGFLRCTEPKEIDLEEFAKRRDEHRISEEERREWWPDATRLYFYPVRDYVPLEQPRRANVPQGAQTFFPLWRVEASLAPENPGALSDEELLERYREVLREWRRRGKRRDDEEALNAYLLLVAELERRKVRFTRDHELDQLAELLENREQIYMSTARQLEEFVWIPDFVSITGSYVYAKGREPNDIDVVVRLDRPDEGLFLKLGRMMARASGKQVHFVTSPYGPNWLHLPVYDLVLRPKRQFKLVEIDELEFAARFYEARVSDPELLRQAERSLEEDRIVPMRFFYGLKPTRPAYPGERQSWQTLWSLVDRYPVYVSKKHDGLRGMIHKKGDEVRFFTEDGQDRTEAIPNVLEAVHHLPVTDLVLDVELEAWDGEKHLPREFISGLLKRKEPDDSLIVANVFSVLYARGRGLPAEGDLHSEPESVRQKVLDALKLPQSTFEIPDTNKKLNRVVDIKVDNLDELKKACRVLSAAPGSEGVVVKKADAVYYLDTDAREGWLKYHHNAVLHGKILERIPTKVEGVYNYVYGVRADRKVPDELKRGEYQVVGKTFSTAEELPVGAVIDVEFETLNLNIDERSGEEYITAWVPRFLGKSEAREPDAGGDVVARARRERILQVKRVTRNGETVYEAKRRDPEDYPQYYAIIVHHFRGKSVHKDFRVKMDGYLEGWTFTDMPEGAIPKEVKTLEQARRFTATVDWKFTPDMGEENRKVVAVPKAKQPLVWLNVREVVYEPGSVGATRFEPGVFVTVDEGFAYPGVKKPYFHEYFLDMKEFKGRMIVRVITVGEEWEEKPKGPVQWQAWMAKKDEESQIPYLLTRRARLKKDYTPAEGEKAIPPEWEAKIKPEHRWWVKDLSPKERLERLDAAYHDLIERGVLKQRPLKEAEERFELRRRWWKGQTVVRDMPVEYFDLVTDSGIWTFEENPLGHPEGVAGVLDAIEGPPLGFEGDIPPGKEGNPNKAIPAHVEVIDRGTLRWLEVSDLFVSFEAKGKLLKGLWHFRREDPHSELWVLRKSAGPGQPRESAELGLPAQILHGGRIYVLSETSRGGLILTALKEHSDLEPCEEGLPKPFSSPGGKDAWLGVLLNKIPPHRVYVEPYVGGGSLFWAKEPSEVEVLSDIDPDVVAVYRFLKEGSDADFAWMRRQKWEWSPVHFESLKASQPKELREQAYRYKYLNLFSHRGKGETLDRTEVAKAASGDVFLRNLEKYRERLKNVKILQQDALNVMREYDSTDTFFYLDPPWKPIVDSPAWQNFDESHFVEVVRHLKGKVLISYQGKLPLEDWHRATLTREKGGIAVSSTQRLYWNYELESAASA